MTSLEVEEERDPGKVENQDGCQYDEYGVSSF